MLVLRQVVVVFVHALDYGVEVLCSILFHDPSFCLVIQSCKILALASNVVFKLIFQERFHESLSWLIKSDLLVFFVYERSRDLSRRIQLLLEFESMSALQRLLMWVLEVNPNVDWELAVACIVYLKRRLVYRDEWLREAFVYLKLDLFYQEGQVLLLHGVIRIVGFSETTNVGAPFVR